MIPVQVEATGRDGIDIPDHEVITRRKQFRMKRNRAEDKRQKKEENSKKKAAKAQEPPKKRGRKAVEKAEPWKEKGRRNDRKNKKQPKIPASSSKGPDCPSHKMKRYRKFAQTLKESNDAVAPVMKSKLAKKHSQTSSKDTKASRKDMEQQHVLDSRVEDSKDPKNEEISQTKIKGEGKKTAAKSKAKQQQKPMHEHDTPPASAKEKQSAPPGQRPRQPPRLSLALSPASQVLKMRRRDRGRGKTSNVQRKTSMQRSQSELGHPERSTRRVWTRRWRTKWSKPWRSARAPIALIRRCKWSGNPMLTLSLTGPEMLVASRLPVHSSPVTRPKVLGRLMSPISPDRPLVSIATSSWPSCGFLDCKLAHGWSMYIKLSWCGSIYWYPDAVSWVYVSSNQIQMSIERSEQII